VDHLRQLVASLVPLRRWSHSPPEFEEDIGEIIDGVADDSILMAFSRTGKPRSGLERVVERKIGPGLQAWAHDQ
jgi:hypothetical protein